jgi:hypothetical protein
VPCDYISAERKRRAAERLAAKLREQRARVERGYAGELRITGEWSERDSEGMMDGCLLAYGAVHGPSEIRKALWALGVDEEEVVLLHGHKH